MQAADDDDDDEEEEENDQYQKMQIEEGLMLENFFFRIFRDKVVSVSRT